MEIVKMKGTNMNRVRLNSTISYIISGIILLSILALLISSQALLISGIIIFVVELIISLIISVIQIFSNLIKSKTMTGKSKQILILSESGGWCESIG